MSIPKTHNDWSQVLDLEPITENETIMGNHDKKEQHASQVNRDGEGTPGDISGYSSATENPSQSAGDLSHLTGREEMSQKARDESKS